MTIKFQKANYSHKGVLATAEIHFSGGPLGGLRLVGFTVTEKRTGRSVEAPSRTYSVNGERRHFALLRPTDDPEAWHRLRDLILDAYRLHELQEQAHEAGVEVASV
jgi:hypothetical protein